MLADRLDAEAQILRLHAATIINTGLPVDVPWDRADGGNLPLHQLTSFDLLTEAEALEADAVKLRTLYN